MAALPYLKHAFNLTILAEPGYETLAAMGRPKRFLRAKAGDSAETLARIAGKVTPANAQQR